jgi:GT2 family glycosyltransferase
MRSCTVIIPVYNSFAETETCLRSVLRSTDSPYRVLVIDDASPAGDLREYLPGDILGHPRIQVVRNAQNLGFVKSCNQGMRDAGEDDVVLLNSDTEVTAGWLDRLRRAAYSSPKIGTVTPLTNNGELVSVPEFFSANQLPPGYRLEEFALLVQRCSARQYVEVPTCVGFCVYIKRELLARIGLFDEESFGRGYGEENDFSCRAQAAGYVDVVDDATYVFHHGETSFQGDKAQLSAQHLDILEKKHPGYQARIKEFARLNPLRDIQSRIRTAMLRRWSQQAEFSLLHVLHKQPFVEASDRLPGGVEYHVADLVRTVPGAAHWSLWADGSVYCLQAHVPGTEVIYRFGKTDFDIGQLINRKLFDTVHLHHASAFPYPQLAEALKRHGRYFVSLHDFALCCPNTNLIDSRGRLCNLDGCERNCCRAAGEVSELRAITADLFQGAAAVFHFSQSTRTHYARCVGDAYRWNLLPHGTTLPLGGAAGLSQPERPQPGPGEPFKVAFLGGISMIKGAALVQQLAAQRKLPDGTPVEWHLAGLYDGRLHSNVINHGRYQREQLPELLAQIAPHLVAILSLCPETYCYTLDEAWACGVPVLVTPQGAPPERVQKYGCGWVLDALDVPAVMARLQDIVRNWPQYGEVRRRIADLDLGDVAAAGTQYLGVYRKTCRRGRRARIAFVLKQLEQLRQGFPCRVPRSRLVAGYVINGSMQLLERTGARPAAARMAARILPIRVKQLIRDLRLDAAGGH